MYYPPTKIYVKEIEGKGLGVFAKESIKKSETIEVCPVYKLKPSDGDWMKDYRFLYPRKRGSDYAIAWGYGSLYNHSDKPNCDWRDYEKGFEFFALRDIKEGEEICVNYGGINYWGERGHIKLI